MLESAADWSCDWSSRAGPRDPRPQAVGRQRPGRWRQPPPSRAPPLRVLVVDDEEDIRVLLRAQLERAGYTVAGEAADGMEALAHCDRDLPDAVVLDLLMPRLNGFEVIPKLRSKHPDVGIIAYT